MPEEHLYLYTVHCSGCGADGKPLPALRVDVRLQTPDPMLAHDRAATAYKASFPGGVFPRGSSILTAREG